MRHLLTLTASGLRHRIRDRSVLIFGVLVPLALMGVLNLVVGGVLDPDLDDVEVVAAAPADDPAARPMLQALHTMQTPAVTLTSSTAEQARTAVQDGTADIALIIPDDFSADLLGGGSPQVTVISAGGSNLSASVVIAVLESLLERLEAGTTTAAAAAGTGIPTSELVELAEQVAMSSAQIELTEGQAASEQLSPSGALVAGQAGLFLLFTVGFGVLGLIEERENGTLARLLSMPMRRSTIVWSKALTSFVLGLVATSVLLVVGGRLFGASFGSVPAVATLVVSAVTASTALMFIVIKVARTAEQAGMAQSIIALVLGIAGGAFFPLAADGTLATLLDLNPVAAFMRGLGITAGGGGIGDIGVPVALLLGFAALAGIIARLIPDRGAAR